MMRLIFILSLVLLTSCAMRSGKYVQVNGKWVFKDSKIGFSNNGLFSKSPSIDYRYVGDFLWPVPSSKKISSHYGKRGSRKHEGIDIPAHAGASIMAAKEGKVTFSGRMRGYGNVVVIKHSGGFHTVYAHNKRNYAKKGQRVSGGEVIAAVGNTGRSTGNHLHFEIRKNNHNQNPMAYYKKIRSGTFASN